MLNITNLHERLVCELYLSCCWSYIVSLYRSPSQSSDEYDHFIKIFEQLVAYLTSFKPHVLLIKVNFNARSSSWWSFDVDNNEVARLKSIISFYGLHQIISFTDLIFNNQPNTITDGGLHPSFHQNCLHKIIFAKVNMKLFYPPPYKHLIWDYRDTNFEAINSAIESFNWENAFDVKDIHAQIAFFNETHLNIFSNFLPKRMKTFTESDPPWMTKSTKNKIKLKNIFYRQYMRHKTQINSFLKV